MVECQMGHLTGQRRLGSSVNFLAGQAVRVGLGTNICGGGGSIHDLGSGAVAIGSIENAVIGGRGHHRFGWTRRRVVRFVASGQFDLLLLLLKLLQVLTVIAVCTIGGRLVRQPVGLLILLLLLLRRRLLLLLNVLLVLALLLELKLLKVVVILIDVTIGRIDHRHRRLLVREYCFHGNRRRWR